MEVSNSKKHLTPPYDPCEVSWELHYGNKLPDGAVQFEPDPPTLPTIGNNA